MKKFLALVLALVMTMSLVTIAGAEDYTDAADMNYAEAVEVMSAVGVVGGYADGSFNPQAGLTRGAAAKIICNMILGPTTAEALVANEAPFADVAVDNVFAGYIAYCANEGIISGYADGTFKPAAPLTGYAFMKMLLGALGYDADVEGYVGSNWSIQVAKKALYLGLDDGLVGAFSGAKALTREEACLYAFNTMNTKMVEYPTSSTISVGDIVIKNNSVASDKGMKLFREQYFSKLDTDPVVGGDDFGRPAHDWTYGKDEIGVYADTADYTIVFEKNYKAEDFNTDAKILKELQDLTGNDDLELYTVGATNDVTMVVNGAANAAAAATAGTIVELFCNLEDEENVVTEIVVSKYSVAKIDKVTTKLTAAEQKKDITAKLTLKDLNGASVGTFADTKIVGYDADTYTKGAYIAYIEKTIDGATKLIDTYVVESVDGKIAAKGSDYVKMDGVKYVVAGTVPGVNFKDEYTLFLSEEGYVLGINGKTTATTAEDLAVVTALYTKTEKGRTTNYAEVVALDGTVSDIKLDKSYEADYKTLVKLAEDEGEYTLTKFDGDDDFDVYAATLSGDGIAKDDTKTTIDSKKVYLDGETAYVSIQNDAKELKVKTAIGGMSCAASDGAYAFVITADGESDALYVVYVGTKLSSAVDTGNVVFVPEVSTESNEDGFATSVYYMEDNTADVVTVKGESAKAVGFYTYSVDADGLYTLTSVTQVKAQGDKFTGWGNIWFREAGIHNTTVTFADTFADLEDVSFADADVIDLRTDATIDASTVAEITSASDIVDAVAEGNVLATIYMDEGVITFIAVKSVG